MSKHVKKLILPFSVAAKDRFKPLTKEMEMAAICYLAERDRKKGEGRVLKKPEEKILFIAETCYPLWLIPWSGKTLVFDGLEFTNKTLFYDVVPDIKGFETDIQASSKAHESYVAALSQNASYFQNFDGKEEKTIEGLITNPEFLHDLMDYLNDAEAMGKYEIPKAILAPMLDESEVSSSVSKLFGLKKMLQDEIKSLAQSMKQLSKASKAQVKVLHSEMALSMKEFDKKIKTVKPKVMEKIKKIKEKRDEEVTRISKKHSRKLRSLHQNRVRIEKTLERFSTDTEHIEADVKVCRDNKDEAREFQLMQKLDEIKKKTPVLNKEIKKIDKEIETVEEAKKIEVTRARTKPEARIEEAMKSLRDIEAAKEARVRLEQQDVVVLENMTSSIIKQIGAMVKEKETALSEIESMGVQEKRRKAALVYLTVYFVCYETEAGKRYVVYPPSTVGSMDIKTKLKGVFGAGKMKCFLDSRSTAIGELLDRLIDLTQENPVFEKEITEAGVKADILRAELRENVKKGIAELKAENWMSESEFQDFNTAST